MRGGEPPRPGPMRCYKVFVYEVKAAYSLKVAAPSDEDARQAAIDGAKAGELLLNEEDETRFVTISYVEGVDPDSWFTQTRSGLRRHREPTLDEAVDAARVAEWR